MLIKSLRELDNMTQAVSKYPGVKRLAVKMGFFEPYFYLENLDLLSRRICLLRIKLTDEYNTMKDVRRPFLRIAKKLDVSPEFVRKRYAKMKEK